MLMYLLANSGANQRYANAYNQYGGYQGGNQGYNNHHYANRRMFDGETERDTCIRKGGMRIMVALTRQWFAYFNPSLLSGSQSGFNFDLLGLVSKAVEVYQKLNGELED